MKKNILIVEDDPFSQDFYKFIFVKAGFNPIILEDGDLVVQTLADESISLIIMDINLRNTYLKGERMDGMKLSRFIKTNDSFPQIPILLVTAYTLNSSTSNFFEESLAEDYITKPIMDFNLLLNKVNKLIEN